MAVAVSIVNSKFTRHQKQKTALMHEKVKQIIPSGGILLDFLVH